MGVLKDFVPLVDFLGQALGPNCEVVLHDLADPEHSIIAIANGHISGRKVGGPSTDLVLKVLKEGLEGGNAYITNYSARNMNNSICRSSSYFIRDEGGKIAGVLCVNVDVSKFAEAKKALELLIGGGAPARAPEKADEAGDVFENLHSSVDDVLTAVIDGVLGKCAVPPDRMSVEEKMAVVKALSENGLFLLKGGVSELARRMQLSEPTIYRYLNKLKD
jgi:predicted transcriptional regulator YheO